MILQLVKFELKGTDPLFCFVLDGESSEAFGTESLITSNAARDVLLRDFAYEAAPWSEGEWVRILDELMRSVRVLYCEGQDVYLRDSEDADGRLFLSREAVLKACGL